MSVVKTWQTEQRLAVLHLSTIGVRLSTVMVALGANTSIIPFREAIIRATPTMFVVSGLFNKFASCYFTVKIIKNMFKNQKGSSIYFALNIMAIIMAIVISISTVIVVQVSNLKQSGDSVVAFYAADAGIEKALYEAKTNGAGPGDPSFTEFLDEAGTASYSATIIATTTAPDLSCIASYYCIRSIGKYESSDTRRGIQISR